MRYGNVDTLVDLEGLPSSCGGGTYACGCVAEDLLTGSGEIRNVCAYSCVLTGFHALPVVPRKTPPQGGGVLSPDGPIAPDFKSVAAAPGTVSDDTRVWQNVTPRSEQVSFCRIWADFRDAAFELARQNREKEQAFFAQKSSFVQCFMGDFYFLRQSGPEILPPGRKNPGPEKEIPGSENKIPSPEIFFPGPVFFRRRLGSTFSRYLELFHRQIPGVNMSAQVPPGLRAPVIPARKQPHPRQKESLCPLFADIWVSARSARLRFLRPPPPPAPYK